MRPDAGHADGFGHLLRCASLAFALRDRGATPVFIVPSDGAVASRLDAWGFGAETVPAADGGDEDLAGFRDAAVRLEAKAIVVDSYRAGAGYFTGLRETGAVVVAVDDWAAFPFDCRLLVNPAVCAASLPYVSARGDTEFLLGPRYALLRPEFRDVGAAAVRPRPRRVLVLTGGADVAGIGPGLVTALDAAVPEGVEIVIALGPLASTLDAVRRAADAASRGVEIVVDPPATADLMASADVAVSAAGQTLLELARVGVPAVAVQVADNQGDHLRGLVSSGAVIPAGDAADRETLARAAALTRALLHDADRRNEIAASGRRLVDGHGAARVAARIAELIAS